MKLTQQLITEITSKRPVDLTKDEAVAIFKIFGLQIKEYSQYTDGNKQTSFEIHHKRTYIINVDADLARAISFNNEWVNFGDGCHGLSMTIDSVGELLLMVFNFFIEKLRVQFDGPEYDEDRFFEYENMEELQSLLEYAQNLITKED